MLVVLFVVIAAAVIGLELGGHCFCCSFRCPLKGNQANSGETLRELQHDPTEASKFK